MFGLNRFPNLTEKSIIDNILKPLNNNFDAVEVFGHFNVPSVINNRRSGEFGDYSPKYFGSINFKKCVYESQDDALIQSFYQVYSHYPLLGEMDQDFSTRKNLFYQLHSLRRLYEIAVESANFTDFDVFVIIRPDLKYIDNICPSDLSKISCGKKDLIVPYWQSCGGINDRFCISSKKGFETYTNRLGLIRQFCSSKGYIHAERLNYFSARKGKLKIDYMKMRAFRVRSGGNMANEVFTDSLAQRLRRIIRRIPLSWI